MKTTLQFSIESLLFGIENPKGNIEQVLFAIKMAEHEGMPKCNRLARLTFNDTKVNQPVAGAVSLDETLILGYEGWNDSVLHLCIRSGRSAVRIASGSFPSREIVMYEEYREAILLNKISDKQIEEFFKELWNNMDLIQPQPKYLWREEI
jgi:sugar diacid utilization regulator